MQRSNNPNLLQESHGVQKFMREKIAKFAIWLSNQMRMGTNLKEVCHGGPRDSGSCEKSATYRFEAELQFPDGSHTGTPRKVAMTNSSVVLGENVLPTDRRRRLLPKHLLPKQKQNKTKYKMLN